MAQTKDKEQYGREFAPECEFEVYELNDNMGWGASVAIGDCYYETDPCKDKQDAIAEQRGCLLAIKEQIENYLATLHRTPADIEAAMQEVEAKSEAYTNAHRGERDDDVLSQMRGEHVSEDLEEAAKEYAIEQVLCSTDTRMTEQAYLGIRLFNGYDLACAYKDGAENQREQMMTKAVDATLLNGNLIKQKHTTHPLHVGDKVKVIVIKED